MIDRSALRAKKRAFEAQYASTSGVEGVGLGEDRLRVYVRSPEVGEHLPCEFEGLRVECVVTGSLRAL